LEASRIRHVMNEGRYAQVTTELNSELDYGARVRSRPDRWKAGIAGL